MEGSCDGGGGSGGGDSGGRFLPHHSFLLLCFLRKLSLKFSSNARSIIPAVPIVN